MAVHYDCDDRPTPSGNLARNPSPKIALEHALIFHEHDIGGLLNVGGKRERRSGGLNNRGPTTLSRQRSISHNRQILIGVYRCIAEIHDGRLFARQAVELGGQVIWHICPNRP